MSNDLRIKAALLVAVGAAALYAGYAGRQESLVIGSLFAFGLFNILYSPPGTAIVRYVSVVAIVAALLAGSLWWMVAMFVGWLVWPPAYAVAWALGKRQLEAASPPRIDATADGRGPKIAAVAIIVAVAAGCLAYRFLVGHNLQQTSALFVGLPALLAIVVVLFVAPRSAIGVAAKAVTVGLLVSLVFLGEGILCVLMSAPLFYFVAIAIAAAMQRSSGERLTTLRSCAAMLIVAPLSLEGVFDATTFDRDETVTVSRIVYATPDAIGCALFAPPRFDRALPFYLRAGFPRAVSTRIERGSGPTRWIVTLRGGEMHLDGMEPRAGDLVLELEELRPGFARWRAASDSSHMTHFLAWRDAAVRWERVGPDATNVTWTLRYRRGLDPVWYFGPPERYAVQLAASYLIDAVATP